MAKVILVDNLNRDEIADEVYAEDLCEAEAERVAKIYNRQNSHVGSWCARAVPDDYKLCQGMRDFV